MKRSAAPVPNKGTLRVLIVEDVRDDADLLLLELRRGGYEVMSERVQTADTMAEALDRQPWDIVCSDWSMPDFSAPAALEILKKTGRDLPFIIVSGTVGEDIAVEALRAGAHDFLVKNRLARFIPAIERELREAKIRGEKTAIQQQLSISDRMASVGILAAGLAHEINNPLAAVLANLELAVRDVAELTKQANETPLVRELTSELADARESAQRIRDIVRDLKLFSRADDDKPGAVDVRRVLESSLRMAHNEIRHRARVVKDFAAVPLVEASESRLGQVFLNLIVNAAQSIPEGRAKDNEIRVRTLMGAHDRIVVEVCDSGSGMSPDVLKRLFQPFFTTKPLGVGTGLGLSICHRIITEAGGEMTVDSVLGKGSTFRVHLRPAGDIRELAPVVKPIASSAARRGRILVIDDEPAIATAIRRMLARDHEVITVNRARQALDAIVAGEQFDVILCDLMMPEMTGMDLYERLHEVAPDQAEKIVFSTGGAFTARGREFLDQVTNPRLEKPFDATALVAMINARVR